MPKTSTIFEEQIRKTEFFKQLAAAGATPAFKKNLGSGITLLFKLPSVSQATQATDLLNQFFTASSTACSYIRNDFRERDLEDEEGLSRMDGVVTHRSGENTFVANVVAVRVSQPNNVKLVDKLISALNQAAEQSPEWLSKPVSVQNDAFQPRIAITLNRAQQDDLVQQITGILAGLDKTSRASLAARIKAELDRGGDELVR